MFALLDKDNGTFHKDPSTGDTLTFETGEQAAQMAKTLSVLLDRKFQPRPFKHTQITDDWMKREQSRFDSGEYTRVLPSLEMYCKPVHFVHISKKHEGMLAYTKDAVDGANDTQKRISVHGYLEQYAPEVNEELRARLARDHAENFVLSEVRFAVTPDEIEGVYTNYEYDSAVSDSCMRYTTRHFKSQVHPTRIYGAGDLAIAYLTNDEGQTTHRTLCWPAKKLYSRMYAPDDRLHNLLKQMGYRKSSGYYNGYGDKEKSDAPSMAGARLLKIESDEYPGVYVAPYCDEIDMMRDCGDHFVLDPNGSYDCQLSNDSNPNGLTQEDDELDGKSCRCERCEQRSDYLTTVNTGRFSKEQWCDDCVSDHAFICEGRNEYYASYTFQSVEINYSTYERSYAENNFNYCHHCNEWTSDELVDVIVSKGGSSEEMCMNCATDEAFECKIDGELYANDLMAPDSETGETNSDGYIIARFIGNDDPDDEDAPCQSGDEDQGELDSVA
jgi:hypothetical protein